MGLRDRCQSAIFFACLCNYPRQYRAFKSDPAKLGMVFLKKYNEQNCFFDRYDESNPEFCLDVDFDCR